MNKSGVIIHEDNTTNKKKRLFFKSKNKKNETNMDMEENKILIENLLSNSKAAIIGAVELHNKPIFPYRYEISVILTINAWELALKAYILQYAPEIKIVYDDKTTKPFEECVRFVGGHIGKEFLQIKESIERLYEYRCNTIHFYSQDIELIIYSLLSPNILSFSDFLKDYFDIDLDEEANLILLPIGFKRAVSPFDFISTKSIESSDAVKAFIKSIVKSTETLIENDIHDSIIVDYRMAIINENRLKNADIIAGVTKDPDRAQIFVNKIINVGELTNDPLVNKVVIDEESIFKTIFTYDYQDLQNWGRQNIKQFKTCKALHGVLKEIKNDPNCYRERPLDYRKPNVSKKGYYSESGLQRAKQEYEKKLDESFDEF